MFKQFSTAPDTQEDSHTTVTHCTYFITSKTHITKRGWGLIGAPIYLIQSPHDSLGRVHSAHAKCILVRISSQYMYWLGGSVTRLVCVHNQPHYPQNVQIVICPSPLCPIVILTNRNKLTNFTKHRSANDRCEEKSRVGRCWNAVFQEGGGALEAEFMAKQSGQRKLFQRGE